MSNPKLTVVDPLEMDSDSLKEWLSDRLTDAHNKILEAEENYRHLQEYHADLAEVFKNTKRILELDSPDDEDKEELDSLIEAAKVIEKAINCIHNEEDFTKDSIGIEELDKGLDNSKELKENHKNKINHILKVYNRNKQAMGWQTQEEVSKRTGIDPRQISRVETGKVLPQFKTLNKLATAFAIDISEFYL